MSEEENNAWIRSIVPEEIPAGEELEYYEKWTNRDAPVCVACGKPPAGRYRVGDSNNWYCQSCLDSIAGSLKPGDDYRKVEYSPFP
jgi:hypothetical protein